MLQGLAREAGEPIPLRLPADTSGFTVPATLVRILDRDMKAAGIPKQADRGRTVDVHATLAELCRWWLDPAQRAAWQVGTIIQGQLRPDRTANDALFRIVLPNREAPIPVFLVITQHWERKRHLHDQLFVPSVQEIMDSARGSDLVGEVTPLIETARAGVAELREGGRQGISLHKPLTTSELQTVQDVVSALVRGLAGLVWALLLRG